MLQPGYFGNSSHNFSVLEQSGTVGKTIIKERF
jgi:hypothetical protein